MHSACLSCLYDFSGLSVCVAVNHDCVCVCVCGCVGGCVVCVCVCVWCEWVGVCVEGGTVSN